MDNKIPLEIAEDRAKHICETLQEFTDRIAIAGSIRRKNTAVHDIDIVAVEKWPTDLFGEMDTSHSSPLRDFLKKKVRLKASGPRLIQFDFAGIAVDLYTPPADNFGSTYFIRTGSEEWNRWIINAVASKRGIIFRKGQILRNNQPQIVRHETDLFGLLDINWVPPTHRHNQLWMKFLD